MFVARHIKTEHKDLIHDVAYDFYGTRMATCSRFALFSKILVIIHSLIVF
jgi:hypothetical protein